MGTVKIYKYKTTYNGQVDGEPIAKRMGTRSFIEEIKCTLIEETELEVDSSKVDASGKTEIGFVG